MEFKHPMGRGCDVCETDNGPRPFVANIMRAERHNQNFRTAFWTGRHLQLTLMSIIPCGEIGADIHPDTDQFIRVEEGEALVRMGDCREKLDFQCRLSAGEAIFVPSGTWHNVLNAGKCPLKLSSVYAPPHHPAGSIHRTKADE